MLKEGNAAMLPSTGDKPTDFGILNRGYIGRVEKKMEATMSKYYRVYIGANIRGHRVCCWLCQLSTLAVSKPYTLNFLFRALSTVPSV